MKYIRTPLGIWEVIEETDTIYCVRAKGNHNHIYNKSKCQTEVIKQADTIEELCDDFIGVLDNGNGSHIWYDEEYLAITEWETQEELSALKFKYAKANLSLNEILYGAIWTDKGLIYVAKMNSKGELELL